MVFLSRGVLKTPHGQIGVVFCVETKPRFEARWCFQISGGVFTNRALSVKVVAQMQMLETEDNTSSNSVIAMTTHEQILQWVANIVFSSSLKLTKSIQTTLKTTALGLGGLEVALSGSMHSDQKFKLLRDKVLLQAEHLIQSHLVENGIKVPSYVTTRVIQRQDLALTREWKLSGTTETAWKLYMSDVADMRNHINPLYENLLKIVGKSKDGHIKVMH